MQYPMSNGEERTIFDALRDVSKPSRRRHFFSSQRL